MDETMEAPQLSALRETESAIADIAARVGPAVVGIGRGWGVGSGVVIEAGRVLTCAHNLRHDEIAVSFSDGRSEPGHVIGVDEELDLALVKVDTADLEPLGLPEDDEGPAAEAGRFVLALANPGGRGLRVTPGFVSSSAGSLRGGRGRRFVGAIEHTAPLPRGSSGGPLVTPDGRLVGINSARVDPGLILAIPAGPSTRARVEAIGRGEPAKPARLGVAVAPPRVARGLRRAVGLPERDGVLVRAVQEASPADRAGLERGDLLVAAGGQALDRIGALYEALDRAHEEGKLELAVVRGAEERTVEVRF